MTKYSADSIRVLEYPDDVREKPSMYIGGTDRAGLWQILKEVITNAFDESSAGYNKKISIEMDTKKNVYSVADAGRGIPVEIHKKTKISTLTTVLTRLHAGAKLSKEDTAYKASAGTHGVGVSVTNALAEYLEVYTFRDKWFFQRFEKGHVKSKVIEKKPNVFAFNKGTVVTFKPDMTLFKSVVMPKKSILEWIDTIAYFYPDVSFRLKVDGKERNFQHKAGISALCDKILKTSEIEPIGKPFSIITPNISVVLQWSNSSNENLLSYVNGLQVQKGTHLTALNALIKKEFEKYKTAKQSFDVEDVKAGLVGIINIAIASPVFSSQTKEVLKSVEGKHLVATIEKEFAAWCLKNKATIKQIIDRAVQLFSLKSDFQVKKALISKVKTEKAGKVIMPEQYLAARKEGPNSEFFLVEGESAKGSARMARNADYQSVLGLKGKIINAIKSPDAKVAANKEIINILKCVGYKPQMKDPFAKLKMGKLIFLSDADPDGAHISLLYSGVVFKLLKPLLKQKMVYYVALPLFTAVYKDKRYYADKLSDLIEKMPKGFNKDKITRLKGLGECDPDVLEEIAFNPDTRKLVRLKYKEGKRLNRYLATLSSENDFRKDILGLNG
jgi:DNA gyrase/topoisomerase IV subunit B